MAEFKFTPKTGQVDYTNIRYAPVVKVIVAKGDKILLVRRSKKLKFYPNYWNSIDGFLDDQLSIEEKAQEELREELGVTKQDIINLKRGNPYIVEAPEYHKTWLIVPVLAEVKNDEFTLDWEAEEARWFRPDEVDKLKLLPGFEKVLKEFFPL